MTTIVNFVTALGDLTITGVTSKLNEVPRSLKTADLPAQWVQLPVSEDAPATFQGHGNLWDVLRAQLVVAYEPVGQGTQAANWSGTITMMDSVRTAIATSGQTVVKGKLTYKISQAEVLVGEQSYWAVVAEVEGHG